MKSVFIYALKDPRDGRVRYIGKANDPEVRLKEHLRISCRKNTHCQNWISSLLAQSFYPVLETLDEVPADKWKFFERAYIKLYRDLGFDLTNTTEGGDGADGLKHSAESRAKISEATRGDKNPFFGKKHTEETLAKMRGRTRSSEHCAKLGAANLGKKRRIRSSEHSAKLRAANRGQKRSLEARAKMSAAHAGQKPSAETQAKMSAARRRNFLRAFLRKNYG